MSRLSGISNFFYMTVLFLNPGTIGHFQRYRVSKKNCNSAKEPSLLIHVEVVNFLNLVRMPYSLVTLCEKMELTAFTVCLFWTFLLRDPLYVFVHEASN